MDARRPSLLHVCATERHPGSNDTMTPLPIQGRPCTGFRSAFTFQDLFLTFLLLFFDKFWYSMGGSCAPVRVWLRLCPALAPVCACSVVERPPLFSGRAGQGSPAGLLFFTAICSLLVNVPTSCTCCLYPSQKPATPATGFGGFFHRPGLY